MPKLNKHWLISIIVSLACVIIFLSFNAVSTADAVSKANDKQATTIPLDNIRNDRLVSKKSYHWIKKNQNKYAKHAIPKKYRKNLYFLNSYTLSKVPAARIPIVYKTLAKGNQHRWFRAMVGHTAYVLLDDHDVPVNSTEEFSKPTISTYVNNPKLAEKEYNSNQKKLIMYNKMVANRKVDLYDQNHMINSGNKNPD